jgi:YVTN family beta-propeller protein
LFQSVVGQAIFARSNCVTFDRGDANAPAIVQRCVGLLGARLSAMRSTFVRACAVAAFCAFAAPADAAPPLRKVAEIDLPGPAGQRFDYMRVDEEGRRLFVTHLGVGQIYVVSLSDLQVKGTITGTPRVEDVAYVPELDRLYTSNWGDNQIGVVDLASLKVVDRIPTGAKPDGIEYAAAFGKVYVSNEQARTVSVIDVHSNRTVKTIPFPSETGMPRYDAVAGKVYVNLQDINFLAVIDARTDTVEAQIPLPGCGANHGMALDAAKRRAFVACRGNNALVVVDLERRQVIARFAIGRGSDFVDFDAALGRIYVPCSDGTMAVIQQDDADHYRQLETVPVSPGVHTAAVDPRTHRVFVAEQLAAGRPVARLVVYEAVAP